MTVRERENHSLKKFKEISLEINPLRENRESGNDTRRRLSPTLSFFFLEFSFFPTAPTLNSSSSLPHLQNHRYIKPILYAPLLISYNHL